MTLAEKLTLRLFLDDEEVPCSPADISGDGFKEIVIYVPAQYLKSDKPRVTVVGDHISYAYWFYQ